MCIRDSRRSAAALRQVRTGYGTKPASARLPSHTVAGSRAPAPSHFRRCHRWSSRWVLPRCVEIGRVLMTTAAFAPASALGCGLGVLTMVLAAEQLMHAVEDDCQRDFAGLGQQRQDLLVLLDNVRFEQ